MLIARLLIEQIRRRQKNDQDERRPGPEQSQVNQEWIAEEIDQRAQDDRDIRDETVLRIRRPLNRVLDRPSEDRDAISCAKHEIHEVTPACEGEFGMSFDWAVRHPLDGVTETRSH